MRELELGGLDGIHEDMTGAPVARIETLVDGGLYFARPTEVSTHSADRMNVIARVTVLACRPSCVCLEDIFDRRRKHPFSRIAEV